MNVGYHCDCESRTGLSDDLWRCDACGEVIRYIDDPNGDVTMTTLHPYNNRKVRTEVVTPGDGRRVDAAGTRAAPCSGRISGESCATCGHDPGDHNDQLICLICHQLCDYCGSFRDQHTAPEWASCQLDMEYADQQAEAMTWWRSQQ